MSINLDSIVQFSNTFLRKAIISTLINPLFCVQRSSKTRLFVKETLHIKDQFAHKSLNVNIKSYECKLF